jgi:hypothetical protein
MQHSTNCAQIQSPLMTPTLTMQQCLTPEAFTTNQTPSMFPVPNFMQPSPVMLIQPPAHNGIPIFNLPQPHLAPMTPSVLMGMQDENTKPPVTMPAMSPSFKPVVPIMVGQSNCFGDYL